jgi:L-fuconolactonase
MTETRPAPHSPSNYLAVRADWLARRSEPALEPDLPIVDAHHHLWDRPGWRYLLDDLVGDIRTAGHNITATVFMQCQAMHRASGPPALRPVGETEFANGVAAMAASGIYGPARICAGIVGHADLRLGAAAEEVLAAHVSAGGGRFRGIRHITTWDADQSLMNPLSAGPPGLLADATFRAGFARLAPLDLSFDAWLFHPQIDELTDLARAFPQTRISINHVGGVVGMGRYAGLRDDVFTHWSRSIRMLAGCPNVVVKLGGLGMRINGFGFETSADPPSSETLAAAWRPYFETCIDAFGVGRCMFESNFPVDKGSYSYGAGWNAFKRLTHGASHAEKTALFSATATSFYRLDGRS